MALRRGGGPPPFLVSRRQAWPCLCRLLQSGSRRDRRRPAWPSFVDDRITSQGTRACLLCRIAPTGGAAAGDRSATRLVFSVVCRFLASRLFGDRVQGTPEEEPLPCSGYVGIALDCSMPSCLHAKTACGRQTCMSSYTMRNFGRPRTGHARLLKQRGLGRLCLFCRGPSPQADHEARSGASGGQAHKGENTGSVSSLVLVSLPACAALGKGDRTSRNTTPSAAHTMP